MATTMADLSLSMHFAALEDPRVERTKLHRLLDILTIALCAVICGADTWVEIEEFGHAKEEWFATFLELEHGIPTHDTFGRVFARLDPEQFGQCFLSWVRAVQRVVPLPRGQQEVIALDGKAVRRSHDRCAGKSAIHMVSAWATGQRLVLAQTQVDEKSNEITALPVLLRQLALSGCIVTIDAMGCQTAIARQIVEQGGDYVLALKGNQGTLAQDVELMFTEGRATGFAEIAHDTHTTTEKDHGRLEIRRHWTIQDPAYIAYLNPQGAWEGLQGVGMVEEERRVGTQVSTEARYYILSKPLAARTFGAAVRSHWGIENRVHWVLDVAFREDESRIRTDHSPANMAIVRHMALNLLTQERTAKVGTKAKRLKAGWDPAYLLTVLQAIPPQIPSRGWHSRCILLGRECDGVAELFEAMNVVPFQTCGVQLGEVVRAEVVVGLLITQDMVGTDQDTVGHRHDRFGPTAAAGETGELGAKVAILGAGSRPGDLTEGSAEPGVALGGLATEALAAALLVAGADTRPRGQMFGRGEAPHVRADFRHQSRGRLLLHPGDRLEQRHGRSERGLRAVHLVLELGEGLLNEVDVRKEAGEQDQVIGLDAPLQGAAQLRQLGPQAPLG